MEQYNFSNSNIDLVCEEVGKFLSTSGVGRREALRIKLTFEEVLLEYQAKFGEEATFKVRCAKRFQSIKVEIIVPGESYDPLNEEGEEDEVIRGLLAGIGLAPTWNYKNGKNYVVFIPKKKNASQTVKMFVSIVLSVVVGFLLTLLPDNIRSSISELFFTPLTNLFMGLISAAAGPLVFLSVLGSICSMGNMETLGKIGKKTITTILGYVAVAGVVLTFIATLFFKVKLGGATGSDFSSVLELIYNIVPSNFFEPFITGNALQVIFIAVMFGVAMLMLSSKVSGVFTLVEQFSAIVQTVMGIISGMLPYAVFVIFANMIASGSLWQLLDSYKMLLIILLLTFVYLASMFLWISLKEKVSPALLIKKALPTFLIAITTASSSAAFSTNVKDSRKKLGIDKKLVNFAIPLGQVLFKPCEFAILTPILFNFAETYGIDITLSWIISGFITTYLVSFALPPVAGGAIMGFTVTFVQLGIPMEAMGIAIALNAITDFPATAMNVTGWQLALIDVADSLGVLDKERLHRKI